MSTPAQISANQHNAQLSTGPTSESGKNTSSRNALKTGLTGRTVLLPTEDAALYEAHLNQFAKRFVPEGDEELSLVQSLADTEWRLMRIPSLELGIYAVGRIELGHLFPNEEPALRHQMIEAKILLTYKRELGNLSIQETRLRRHRQQDLATLKELQDARHEQSRKRLEAAARSYIVAIEENTSDDFDLGRFGFEFSLTEIELCAMDLCPDLFAEYEAELARKRKQTAAMQVRVAAMSPDSELERKNGSSIR